MGYYINSEIGYYEGDQITPMDLPVPQRLDASYDWNGTAWVQNAIRATQAKNEQLQASIDALGSTGSDASMSRGLEDLIGLLVGKGMIAKSDLPTALLSKINNRRTMRGQPLL